MIMSATGYQPRHAAHWHAGTNVAGYLPDSDVAWAGHTDWQDARDDLAYDLRDALDSLAYQWGDEDPGPRTAALEASLGGAMKALDAAPPGEDFLAYTTDGGEHTLPTAWQVTQCTQAQCQLDD